MKSQDSFLPRRTPIQVESRGASAPRLELTITEPSRILEAVLVRVEDLAGVSRVRLFLAAGSGEVYGDADALTEALANIVVNAIQSSPVGGSVIVASNQGRDAGHVWRVRDTGSGIPRRVFPYVGTPFFSRRNTGSGPRIVLARDIVERHDGLIQVKSTAGFGTLVSMWLPSAASRISIRQTHGFP